MSVMGPPAWLTFPDSSVELCLRLTASGASELVVACNSRGLGSLVGVLLWLTSYSDHGALSVSGLPFVKPEGSLALSVVIPFEEQAFHGHLVRVDKDRQFEWQIHDEQLTAVALQLHRVAVNSEYIDYFQVDVSPESDASLLFLVKDSDDETRLAT